jgi:hypothetical protein
MQNRNEIVEALRDRSLIVEFNKKNGDFRRMTCTLNSDLIPEDQIPKTTENKVKENDTTVRCFDLDANGWRSFIVENVLKVESLDA